jgi:DNA replication protein DnaC
MLTNQTLEHLRAMKLKGFAEGYLRQMEMAQIHTLSFDDRLGMLVEEEWLSRQNRKQKRFIQNARMRDAACMEAIDYAHPRGMNRELMQRLSLGTWLRENQNILITGPTGVGKTFLACALGNLACRMYFSVRYYRLPRLISEISMSRGDGSYIRLLDYLRKVHVLILDDWGLSPFTAQESREMLEVIEDRTSQACTIIVGQVPPGHWHELMPDPTVADAIMDRLIHSAHIIELNGGSMRKHRRKPNLYGELNDK